MANQQPSIERAFICCTAELSSTLCCLQTCLFYLPEAQPHRKGSLIIAAMDAGVFHKRRCTPSANRKESILPCSDLVAPDQLSSNTAMASLWVVDPTLVTGNIAIISHNDMVNGFLNFNLYFFNSSLYITVWLILFLRWIWRVCTANFWDNSILIKAANFLQNLLKIILLQQWVVV